MKYCEELGALLDLYVDGELSPRESARVRAHLESCPGCRTYVEDALTIRAALADMAEAEPPEGFAESVMNAVRESGTAPSPARRETRPGNRRSWGKTLLPLAACAAVVVLLRCGPVKSSTDGLNAAAPAAPESAPETGMVQYYALPAEEAPAITGTPAEIPQAAASEPDSAVPSMACAAPEAPETVFSAQSRMDEDRPEAEEPPALGGEASPAAYASGGKTRDACDPGRILRLTSAQAEGLLEDVPYTAGEDGTRCYRLTGEAFDALLEALAERNVEPEEESAAGSADMSGGGLVYVEEAP